MSNRTRYDPLDIADSPPIPGLTFRLYRGQADLPVIVEVVNACFKADGIEQTRTPASVANVFSHTKNLDPALNVTLVEIDDRPIGTSRFWWDVDGTGQRIHFSLGYILPEWRGQGIGTALLHHNQHRLRALTSEQPGGPRFFETWCTDAETHYRRMLARDGYQPLAHHADMLRPTLDDIPAVPLPPGLEVRPVLPEHYRAIWEADQEGFADSWGHVPGGEEEYQKFLNFPHSEPALWRVAWDGDQIAGQVRSFIDPAENDEFQRQRGYTEDISTRPPWRRRGLARALIALSLHALRERGMAEAALFVNTQNPHGALGLYQSMGFEIIRTSAIYRKPID